MGRPSKLDDDRQERIRQAILAGGSIEVAARHGGIHPDTHYEWASRGTAALETVDFDLDAVPEPERRFAVYSDTIATARRQWELNQIALIQRAGQGQPWRETTTTVKENEDGTETTTVVREGVKWDWRAPAWLLERRYPQEYGRLTRTWLSGPDDKPIEIQAEELVARGEEAIDEVARKRDQRQAG